MTKRMLIDATHPEETRVAVVDGTRLEEFDFEIASKRQIKSNIYLAKVTRVEPSLQAAFVEYGGNRHGFLPFPEIHPDYYRIPVGDRHAFADEDEDRKDNVREPAPDDAHDSPHDETDTVDRPPAERPAEAAPAETVSELIEAAPPVPAAYDTDEPPLFPLGPEEPPVAPAERGETEARDEQSAGQTEPAEPHDDHADHHAEPRAHAEGANGAAESGVEIVGGDEVEEVQRRRRAQMPHYKIQEVIKRWQIMLVQVSKEERGNKGAAVTTFLSLPGRYCVLMPNTTRGGGVSRKIANPADRKRMKELIADLEVPEGMSVILRTAGVERSKAEIKRDLEYLLRLWENIRTLTLESTAPALIYEEGNLIKRAIRDLYGRDIGQIEIAGDEGYRQAKDFMRMLMPSHAKRVQPYRDPAIPLFFRYQVEGQIDAMHHPVAHLRSGGYIVINQTEALVSIDVNSGRSTRERNIEETALKTNLEAADEIARQLRLRDLGGLIVIDFIDMDEPRHDSQVERRLKEAMKNDRARIQVGRISPFGLLELSRQRLHPSLIETNFQVCPHCLGTGLVRSIESAALLVLRAIEEEGVKRRSAELAVTVASKIALYILNQKRTALTEIEQRYGFTVRLLADDTLIPPDHRIERVKMRPPGADVPPPLNLTEIMAVDDDIEDESETEEQEESQPEEHRETRPENGEEGGEHKRRRRRGRRRRGGRDRFEDGQSPPRDSQPRDQGMPPAEHGAAPMEGESQPEESHAFGGEPGDARGEGRPEGEGGRRRRRGRRGGRGRSRRGGEEGRRSELPPLEHEQAEVHAFAGADDRGAAQSYDYRPAPEQQAPSEWTPEPAPVAHHEESEAPKPIARPAEPEPAPMAPSSAPPVSRDFETVNELPEQPRRGWWKRLTE